MKIIRPVISLAIVVLIGLLTAGCRQNSFKIGGEFVPCEGDLLFRDGECGPLCDAIKKVTKGYGGAAFTHVGIAAKSADGNCVVIEASSKGVCVTPLQTFLDRSQDAKGRPKVIVGRLKPAFRHLIPSAVKNAYALTGKPYDKAFVINNDSYYCSELIYQIFLEANNSKAVFELQPMTFKDPATGDIMPAWRDYFAELGISVPEGQPGINPGGISRSPAITIVHIYGIPSGWAEKNNIALPAE